MSTVTREFCVACRDERSIRHECQRTEYDVRGEKIVLKLPVALCETCGTTVVEGDFDPPAMVFAEYRQRNGLLTPERIKDIRKRYSLSQKSFAALLGMSEATINRYEGGGLQDHAHDQAIRGCENPGVVRDLLDRRGDRLSDWQRKRVEAALAGEPAPRRRSTPGGMSAGMVKERTPQTGYQKFAYLRYAAVVTWLCKSLPLVTATSLNKLLFYVDFLHYKSEAVSLTGSAYRRMQYGPVPTNYGELREKMELDEFIETKEVQNANGRTSTEFSVGPKADEISVQFTARELKILEDVAQKFRGATPSEISDRSHEETAWQDTEDKALITYDKAMNLSLPVPV